MKLNLASVFTVIVIVSIAVLILYAQNKATNALLTEKAKKQIKENFSSGQLITPDTIQGQSSEPVPGPAPASLNERIPYHLLRGVLPNAKIDNQDNSMLNSCACHHIDFANRIQRTGNYTQFTNNYKRMNPDSCSAPFHELVNNFYQPQKLEV